jgi:RNA 3'-terminal phosphate cyclase (ATP)
VIEVRCDHVTEVFAGIGERGVRAEAVADRAAQEARGWLASGAPVGMHLADQVLLPMAVAGGGRFRTMMLTRHTTTEMEVIRAFLEAEIEAREVGEKIVEVEIRRKGAQML